MLLEIENLKAGYGNIQVLFDISMQINKGEAIAIVGRNGMGKTTTINAIMGICAPTGGNVFFNGQRIDGRSSHEIARRGIGLVPEGRRIFPNLSVRENLLVAARPSLSGNSDWKLDRVLELFPRLRERLTNQGGQLSGGEQQMLAVGRALLTNPEMLIFDEATEGLAPIIRQEIWAIIRALKQNDVSMIIIDKEIDTLCELAERHYIIEKGYTVWHGPGRELATNTDLIHRYLGVGA